MSWKLCVSASREQVEAALAEREAMPDWDENIVLTGHGPPDSPANWQLDAYTTDKPSTAQREAVRALFTGKAPRLKAEQLPETDWVSESQKGTEPIRAGRFHVHTPEYPASEEPAVTSFCIPAAQAFGTGQHATTAGCLAMLDAMQRSGLSLRNIADIGTGTGLLAFAANRLWPLARVIASDIDPVCEDAVLGNAALNNVRTGSQAGQVTMVIADGMDDEALTKREPYDLIIANILAGPLIDLAPDFACALAPRGHVLLAGLLTEQEADVRRAYFRMGLRLHKRLVNGDWSILWLRARYVW